MGNTETLPLAPQFAGATVPISVLKLPALLSDEQFAIASAIVNQPRWYFGHRSNAHSAPFWRMDLDAENRTTQLFESLRPTCEQAIGEPLIVLRQYANGHTYGQGGEIHTDDKRAGCYTLLLYPMPLWEQHWEGETEFYDAKGQLAQAHFPEPRSGLLFDGRIPHRGRGPAKAFDGLRMSLAFKVITRSAFASTALPTFQLQRSELLQNLLKPSDATTEDQQLEVQTQLVELLAAAAPQAPSLAEVTREVTTIVMGLADPHHGLSNDELTTIATQRVQSGKTVLHLGRALGFEYANPRLESYVISELTRRAIF